MIDVAFWSSETLKRRIAAEHLIIPYKPERIKHSAYELSVGNEAFLTSDETGKKHTVEDQLVIPPGQLALLITYEEIAIPLNAVSLISIKAGIKFRGLVNVSGFHVDPGFRGRLKFSVYNAGSQNIVLSRGQPAFLIWFCDLDQETKDTYLGDHLNQRAISEEDVMKLQGEVASPQQLKKEIQDLQNSLNNIKTILGILGGAAVSMVVGILLIYLRASPTPVNAPTQPTAVQQSAPAAENRPLAPDVPAKSKTKETPLSPSAAKSRSNNQ